ncbi:MAG: biopolymer transporter ExbD [Pseudomonadota bacterium]
MGSKAASLSTSHNLAEPMIEMNMTPLIDVMLVLIIMLIITIPRQNQSVDMSLPGKGSNDAPPLVIDISVTHDGSILWNGTAVADRASLIRQLLVVAKAGKSEVHLRPDRAAPYKVVAGILTVAKRSGVVNIGVVGNEQLM